MPIGRRTSAGDIEVIPLYLRHQAPHGRPGKLSYVAKQGWSDPGKLSEAPMNPQNSAIF